MAAMLAQLAGLLARGAIAPLPFEAYDVRQAPHALRFMQQARHVGKLVLTAPRALDPGGTVLLTGGTGELGRAVARLLAGEWSRLEVEYEPVHATLAGGGPWSGGDGPRGAGPGGPHAAFLVVGGLVLDLGVRRLLRHQGLAAPPFGSAFLWLAEGERAAGTWFARAAALPGRGSLVRFGRPDTPAWELAAVDPEAAPALPAAREPALRELSEGLGWSVVRLVEDALPTLDPVRRQVAGAEDEGAFLAWAYALAVDEALERLADRGLVAPPPTGVVAVRVADPALAGA
jgi:hypothetical protein